MANELHIRSEDIRPDEVLRYLVDTPADRQVIESLKARTPVVVQGSRGAGKSFLLRATEAELRRDLSTTNILPVYVSFVKAGIIRTQSEDVFLAWMSAKICNRIVRACSSIGLVFPRGSAVSALRGLGADAASESKMEQVERMLEDSWRSRTRPRTDSVPTPDVVVDACEDLCRELGLERIVLLVDEAAHVFIPSQQRQFFTLMRDLRSPYLSVKAAVYPGTTAYGDTFQPGHDARFVVLDRRVTDDGYAACMKEMVLRQNPNLTAAVGHFGEEFETLAFAASGNPRALFETMSHGNSFNRRSAEEALRWYYRGDMWGEHSKLASQYPGHRELVDWGRNFVESVALPELYERNRRLSEQSSFLWFHKDSPTPVREALDLLCYAGILQQWESGIRAHEQVGTRYLVNLGCHFAMDGDPLKYGLAVRMALNVRRMVEYPASHASYRAIEAVRLERPDRPVNRALQARLHSPIEVLRISAFQRQTLRGLGLTTIRDVLAAEDAAFLSAKYVGGKRARQIKNAAVAAVLEYLSG